MTDEDRQKGSVAELKRPRLDRHVTKELGRLERRLEEAGIDGLTAMGYEKYMATSLWKKISQWIKERDGHQCVICHSRRVRIIGNSTFGVGLDVHHRRYDKDTLSGKDEDALVTLCRNCHDKIEYYSNGEKRVSLDEKDAEYSRLLRIHKKIEGDGIPLIVTESTSRGVTRVIVRCSGSDEYKEFESLDELMLTVVWALGRRDSNLLTIRSNTKNEAIKRKSGIKLLETTTGKPAVTFNVLENEAEIKISRNLPIPVSSFLQMLRDTLSANKYWYVVR